MSTPTEIRYRKNSKILCIQFDDGLNAELSAEYLRVHSPSAEVKGHGPGQEVLQTDKQDVAISKIEPIGNYAVRLVFDDGHDSGLYSWKYLHELSEHQEDNWHKYLQRCKDAGVRREA
ncbi:MAG: DUF971 domain-containing protein [Pseudomonadota bacterium]